MLRQLITCFVHSRHSHVVRSLEKNSRHERILSQSLAKKSHHVGWDTHSLQVDVIERLVENLQTEADRCIEDACGIERDKHTVNGRLLKPVIMLPLVGGPVLAQKLNTLSEHVRDSFEFRPFSQVDSCVRTLEELVVSKVLSMCNQIPRETCSVRWAHLDEFGQYAFGMELHKLQT